jgi:hypothetical protein
VTFPCPCCGCLVFTEAPGSYDICPVCGWEDDVSQLRFPTAGGGANAVSLMEAQQLHRRGKQAKSSGALSQEQSPFGREAAWRPVDPELDAFETPVAGLEYGASYPDDATLLYYWRPTYWRAR